MSTRTYRARGVILLLVSILGVGLATIWARSLQPVASDLQRVDALLSLLQQMRLLWEYQFVLTRQVDGSLEWLGTRDGGVDDRATVFEAVFGTAEKVTDGGNTVDNSRRVRNGIWRFGRISTDDASSTAPATLPDAERATATDAAALRSAWQNLMTQRIHPEDLGYTGEFLPCAVDPVAPVPGEDSPDAQLCWQVRAATSGTRPVLHFWVNVGNSEDLRELLWRLRASDWSQSATFCPMRESEMGDALTDADLDFADDGTIICPSLDISNTALADRNLLGLGEVEADMTVLLGRWVVDSEQTNTSQVYAYKKEDGTPYESLVLPPEIFLHGLDEVSAYRLYPTFLHPGRGAEDIVANPHPFGVGSDYRSGSEAVIRVQPFASDEVLPYATSLAPHQRCYEHFTRKADSAAAVGAQKVDTVWLPALPLECNTQTMFGGNSDPLNRLGDHPDHATDFGFADTEHRYPPQLTFAAAPMGRGKSGFAGSPTARGSIMAKWLYIRHLMGSVFLAPNIGPRPKNANDALDFSNELAWPGMGDGCFSEDEDEDELGDCSYLTVAADTVVFSEAIVAMGTVTTTARVPSQGSIWAQGPELALESIRPYRYELSDGKPTIGFLAQEVKSVYPQAVQQAGDSLALGYYSLLPVLHRQLGEIRHQHRDSIGQHRGSIEQNRGSIEQNRDSIGQHRDSIKQNRDSIEALRARLAFLQGPG